MNAITGKLVSMGSSQGIRIPKTLIKMYQLEKDIVLIPQKQGLLISPNIKSRQDRWKQYADAIAAGYLPDTEKEFGFQENDFDNNERTW